MLVNFVPIVNIDPPAEQFYSSTQQCRDRPQMPLDLQLPLHTPTPNLVAYVQPPQTHSPRHHSQGRTTSLPEQVLRQVVEGPLEGLHLLQKQRPRKLRD